MANDDKSYYGSAAQENDSSGEIRISNEVVGKIASHAALSIEGVHSLTEGIVDGISKMLQGELTEGIYVHNVLGAEDDAYAVEIDLSLIITFGHNIQSVASKVQDNVKEQVESSTGIQVMRVNVNIQGVEFSPGNK